MGRALRLAPANIIYHALNRASGRMVIFQKDADYQAFEKVLEEAKEKCPIRLLSYEIMPTHWHLVLQPYNDGGLSRFIRWLTLTHTQRWNKHYQHVGWGHLYQGRFKSFPVETDAYFIQLCRYVESNALRAGLVKRAEDWQWSSLWRRTKGTEEQKRLLDPWPIPLEENYLETINKKIPEDQTDFIRKCVQKGSPFGKDNWVKSTADQLKLISSLKSRGRQPKST